MKLSKLLVPADDREHLRCQSINPRPEFAPFDIHLDDVICVYRVLGSFITK